MTDNYLRYYDLETYVCTDVRERFHKEGKLDAFDLFSIIIWKANRAKSRLARRLMKEKDADLEIAATKFTVALAARQTPQERFILVMRDWGFYLPMTSAILSVLWPEDFTVYDYRLCEELGEFKNLGNLIPENAWPGYQRYCNVVRNHPDVAAIVDLRDKDRFFWGRSAALQLRSDVTSGFRIPVGIPNEIIEG